MRAELSVRPLPQAQVGSLDLPAPTPRQRSAGERIPPWMAGTGWYLYVPAVTATWAIAALLPSRLSIAGLPLIASSATLWLARPWRLVDFHWSEASSCVGVTDPCVIPINPPGWTIVVRPKPSP